MVETDVHYPTDINLLFDAIRKTIEECARLSKACQLAGWRQSNHNIRWFKKQYRIIQKLKHSTSKDEHKKSAREEEIRQEHLKYVVLALTYLHRAQTSLKELEKQVLNPYELLYLQQCMNYAEKFIGQSIRRVHFNETIHHHEKISPSSSPTPSGSARARREFQRNWDCRSASLKTSINSFSTIR